MPQGTFNVRRVIENLGHKNQAEMPVSLNVQATLPLQSMYGQVPVHVAGVAMFGANAPAVAGESSQLRITCMDPGGAIVQFCHVATNNQNIYLSIHDPGGIAWGATGPVNVPAFDYTNQPTRSTAAYGSLAILFDPLRPMFGTHNESNILQGGAFAPWYVPRGKVLVIANATANFSTSFVVGWVGIGASEQDE